MDNSNSRRYTAPAQFWDAYRACVEENRVDHGHSIYYVKWVKAFYKFPPEKKLRDRTGYGEFSCRLKKSTQP